MNINFAPQKRNVMREYSIGIAQSLGPNLPPEQIRQLGDAGRELRFEKDQIIYRQGEPAETTYLLTSGRANTFLVSSEGQESLLRIHLPGSVLGLTALATRHIRDASAVAVEASVAIEITRESFQELLQSDPALGEYFITLLLDRMSDFHYRVGEFLSQTVEQRLSTALLVLSQPDGSTDRQASPEAVILTHEQLAHLINTRRPTVSAILSRFAGASLISKSGRGIVVNDRDGLARLANGAAAS
jgi:CRP-like cAMP-binding protein